MQKISLTQQRKIYHLSHSKVFCRRVDGDENEVCFFDTTNNISGEKEIPPSALLNNFHKTRLKIKFFVLHFF